MKTRNLFTPRHVTEDWWSAGAYLINRKVLQPVIDEIVSEGPDGLLQIKMIAVIGYPCVPIDSDCCVDGYFQHKNPICVFSPKGINADFFIYSLNRTYAMNIPLVSTSVGGLNSTIHPGNMWYHKIIESHIKKCQASLLRVPSLLPSFAKPLCK